VYCTRCGHANPDEASFCASCGQPLQAADDATLAITIEPDETEDSPSLEGLRGDQALLVIKGGPTAGSTVLLEKDVTVCGRNPKSDVFLNDISVSRRHAEIHRDGSRFTLKDAGSLNGTYVNRERVEQASLSSGDELQVGRFKLIFYTAPGGNA
jgi:hypothetical protein